MTRINTNKHYEIYVMLAQALNIERRMCNDASNVMIYVDENDHFETKETFMPRHCRRASVYNWIRKNKLVWVHYD